MIIYYRGKIIQEKFGWTRQRLSYVAQRENWRSREDTWPLYYRKEDVKDYYISRQHTRLAIEKGLWPGNARLIRHKAGVNNNCPICKEILQKEGSML